MVLVAWQRFAGVLCLCFCLAVASCHSCCSTGHLHCKDALDGGYSPVNVVGRGLVQVAASAGWHIMMMTGMLQVER
jgi:hypothetical protein